MESAIASAFMLVGQVPKTCDLRKRGSHGTHIDSGSGEALVIHMTRVNVRDVEASLSTNGPHVEDAEWNTELCANAILAAPRRSECRFYQM
jgi:hypothetical protein